MGTPRVSVIIPATSRPELLRACLRSLARFAPRDIPFETIVVLNEARAEVTVDPDQAPPGLQVIRSAVNLGMAGSGNRGRQLATGELLITLHDDTEIGPGWMEALVETADTHPEAGAIGGQVLYPDGSLQDAGMILWRDATTSQPWVGETPPPERFDRVRAVDYCGSSALLVRTAAWDAAGGLEERFYPAYYVDVDLSMALRQLGLVVLYQPAAVIRHHRGASSPLRFRQFVSARNRSWFLEKWGAALADHEPPDRSRAGIERAMARAERFAELCRRRGPAPNAPQRESVPFDPVLQERRHRKKSRALRMAYARHRLTAFFGRVVDGLRQRLALRILN